jgi:dsRNA-specific ribonuclease
VVVADAGPGADAVPAAHLAALEAAREFRLARHAVSAEQLERLRRELPLPHLLVPSVGEEQIGPAETQVLADALAAAVGSLVPEGAA